MRKRTLLCLHMFDGHFFLDIRLNIYTDHSYFSTSYILVGALNYSGITNYTFPKALASFNEMCQDKNELTLTEAKQ